jgi:hypothetical protein
MFSLRGFSRHDSINDSKRSPKRLLCLSDLGVLQHGFACVTSYVLRATIPSVTSFNSMRPPIIQTNIRRYRNINLFSIVYPFRTWLRSRLTLRWRASRRKPWVYGEGNSHPFYRYSCLHAHFQTLHHSLPVWLQRCLERSPTTRINTNLELRCTS